MKLIMENWRKYVNEQSFLPGDRSMSIPGLPSYLSKLPKILMDNKDVICPGVKRDLIVKAIEIFDPDTSEKMIKAKLDLPSDVMPIVRLLLDIYRMNSDDPDFKQGVMTAMDFVCDASASGAVDTAVDVLNTGLGALGLEEGQRGFCVRDSDGTIYPASESDGRTCRSKVDHSFSSRAAAESFVEENYEDED